MDNKTVLDQTLQKLQTVYESVETDRSFIVNKLRSVVDKIQLNPNEDSPRLTQVKLATINTLDNVLKNMQNSAASNAKLQMQKRDVETSESTKQLVIEMLKNIDVRFGHQKPKTSVNIPTDLDKTIDNAIDIIDKPINDTELEQNSLQE